MSDSFSVAELNSLMSRLQQVKIAEGVLAERIKKHKEAEAALLLEGKALGLEGIDLREMLKDASRVYQVLLAAESERIAQAEAQIAQYKGVLE